MPEADPDPSIATPDGAPRKSFLVTSRRGLFGAAVAITLAAAPAIAIASDTPIVTAFASYCHVHARLIACDDLADDARDQLCAQLTPYRDQIGALPAQDAQDVAIKAWLALAYFDDDADDSGMAFHAAVRRIFPRIAALTAPVQS